jgi:tRNA A-37 threonylcarbamoyl transferase component Bud32
MHRDDHRGEPGGDPEHLRFLGDLTGSGVIFVQKSLSAIDHELAALASDDSPMAVGARLVLNWLRDGGEAPSDIIRLQCLS